MSAITDSIVTEIKDRIAAELRDRRGYSAAAFPKRIESGDGQAVIEALVFFADPTDLVQQFDDLHTVLAGRFSSASPEARSRALDFLFDFTVALRSFLPAWNLRNGDLHGNRAIDQSALDKVPTKAQNLLENLEQEAPTEAAAILELRRADAEARLTAEAAADPAGMAAALTGDSLAAHADNLSAAMRASNMRRLAELRASGDSLTELGNDYAIFLRHTMCVGMSFVTSNPVLVDIAWAADPNTWCPVIDAVVAANPDADESELARLATLEVMLANMRLLRPIFLLTGGKMGYVSLQVNPKMHGDHESMIADATSLYDELSRRLGGGVPNVVFKLPATKAGLIACRHITSGGTGVNITVNFAMFQQLPFAQAIHEGQAIASYLTEMNGRLAYPVRNELLSRLDTFQAQGVGESRVRAAAAWSGVAVTRRLHRLLNERGFDLSRVRPLIASLRWYDGAGYESLPNPCPDVMECAGVSVITIFPNIRHALDELDNIQWRPSAIGDVVAAEHLEILKESELFKQAYYVSDSNWVSDDSAFAPDFEISLDDDEATAAFVPVGATISEFGGVYDVFVRRLLGRRALLALSSEDDGQTPDPGHLQTVLTDPLADTVIAGLKIANTAGADPGIAGMLNSEEVRAAIKSAGQSAAEVHELALARHAQ
jgi:hypothetical protein